MRLPTGYAVDRGCFFWPTSLKVGSRQDFALEDHQHTIASLVLAPGSV
jgi:hypothetical protein